MNGRLPEGPLLVVLVLSLGIPLVAATMRVTPTSGTDEPRRLLVECPNTHASEFAVELGDLRSDIELGNVVSVVDGNGSNVQWSISPERDWVVFKATPGARCEILVAPDSDRPPTENMRNMRPLPGVLTLTSTGIWIREGDHGTRLEWLSNRLSRVAGAVLETQDRSEVERAVATHADQLAAVGLERINPAPPFELERQLVAEQPDFTKLMGRLLDADLQARAEIFVTLGRVLKTNMGLCRQASIAEIGPWDIVDKGGVVARLEGRIILDRKETLTFTPYSVFGGVLRIDGRTVAAIRLSKEVEPDGWQVRAPVSLSAGVHEIEFIAQGKRSEFKAGIDWIPPGKHQKRPMVAADFAPAVRARVVGFVSPDRSRPHPLVHLTQRGRTGLRDRSRYWATLHSLSGNATWTIGSHSRQGESIDICVPPDTSIETDLNGKTFSITLDDERFRYLGGGIDARSEVPHFLFNEEQLKGRLILLSETTAPLTVHAEGVHAYEPEGDEPLLSEKITLGGRSSQGADHLASSSRRVLDFDLDGNKLQPGDTLNLKVTCLPTSFLDESIKIIAPDDCAGIQSDENGYLRDATGSRILVRLTHPSLSDRRRWGIPRGLIMASRPPERLLIVASPEEWGNDAFVAALNAQMQARGRTAHLEPWSAAPAGVPRILGSIGNITQTVETGDYDAILLLPPLSDLAEGGDYRTLSRAVACLAEMSSSRLGRQRVWLALPPSYRPDTHHSEPFQTELIGVINNYGINALPLAAWLERRPDELKSAYQELGIIQPGPVGIHDEVAAYLITWIYGD